MKKLISVVFVAALVGCGTPTKNTDAGVDAGPQGPESACGHPGDPGNSQGVGQYCMDSSDCSNQSAVCSTLEASLFPDSGIPPTYFCTIPGCDPCADAQTTATVCGPNAICACFGGAGCGCAPASCSALVPDGGSCGDAGS